MVQCSEREREGGKEEERTCGRNKLQHNLQEEVYRREATSCPLDRNGTDNELAADAQLKLFEDWSVVVGPNSISD